LKAIRQLADCRGKLIMNDASRFIVASIALLVSCGVRGTSAQAPETGDELVIASGRPLRVALDQRVTVKHVGQPVTGVLTEAVYAYDRIVFPAGVRVLGHVSAIEEAPKMTRAKAWLGGSFVPIRQVTVSFDTVVMDDGLQIPVQTVITGTPSRVKREVAGGSKKKEEAQEQETQSRVVARAKDEVQRARDEIVQRKNDAIAAIKEPGKIDHLKEMAIDLLPYHPQFLAKGVVYNAELVSPVRMGAATPIARALPGMLPAPDSILKVRLVTALDSAKTPHGTPIEGVVTEPVFTADHELILAEGTTLRGEVTFTKTARSFRRNGQLRFLFESIQPPAQEPRKLLASLYSVEAGAGDHVAIDDEGGSSVSNSKTRFIAPVLALLALRANSGNEQRRPDGDADDGETIATGGVGTRGLGGFLGFGTVGAVVSQFAPPVAIAVGAIGVVRTVYGNLLAKGQEVSFPADTPLQVRLAPGPSPAK
jgi:hypothetical protein